MAAVAVESDLGEVLGGVAEDTRRVAVRTDQREAGGIVVEAGLCPRGFRVAILAALSEMAIVCVLLPVTVEAAAGNLAQLLPGGVTGLARCETVGSLERVVRLCVIEGVGVEADGIEVAALVLGVAAPTSGLAGSWRAPVEPGARLEIARHLLVTLQTEPSFGVGMERAMAARAFALHLGMPLDHGPGHDETLEISGENVGG